MNYDKIKKTISRQLKELRKNNKETQKNLASAIGISTENLAKIEQGKTNLTLENLSQIVEHYHVSYDYICKGDDSGTLLEHLESFISIKYRTVTVGVQQFKYPVLQINQPLLYYLLQSAHIEQDITLPDNVKECWIKEEQKKFYSHIDKNNFNQCSDLVLVNEQLIYPDEKKVDWKQSDLLGEIDRQINSASFK